MLAGGGTGGHVYPAIALAEAFASDAACAPLELTFVGTRAGLEARIVPNSGNAIRFVRAAPLVRKISLSFVRTLATNVAGFVDALGILGRLQPDVLVATGGYVSLPVVAASRFLRALGRSHARIAVLEPNAVAGLTNRLLAPLVDEVWYSIAPPGRALGARESLVGTPVRASMREPLDARVARAALALDPAKTTVVVMGGSQGARSINEAVAGFVEAGVPAGWQILVLAGDRDFVDLAARLRDRANATVLAYLDDPRVAYAAADVVVARAGASTLGELAATATPALLVPYPYATDDHQTHNARAFTARGAARAIADGALDAARLGRELHEMLAPDALAALRVAARAGAIADPAASVVARVKAWPASKPSPP